MDASRIREEALRQVAEEEFKKRVAEEVVRIKAYRPWWHSLFPFVITIKRRV